MKKGLKRISLAVLMLVLVIGTLTGCGSSKPTADDAKAYVKAVLDVMCIGDYDHSVNLADIEQGTEGELRDQMVEEALANFGSENSISDEVKADFKECLIKAFSLASYDVVDAVETDDGGYDVTVSIEPLRLYDGFSDNFEAYVQERVMEDYDAVINMSEAEQNNYVMALIVEMLNKNLEDPKYDEAVDVTVHYGLLDGEEKAYGCTSEDGVKLGEKIFSTAGID